MTPFAIAGMQIELSALHGNLKKMGERLDLLMFPYPWVQMVVFSELAVHGPLPGKAETLPGQTEEDFQKMAQKHKVWLIPGTLFEKKDHKIYNTASVIDPDGTIVGRYRKMFPFLPYEAGIEPGSEFLVFDVPEVGRFGVSICYDAWFPETSRTLAVMGAEVIIHPSMTTTIDRDVELAIARTTAATNQCFFVDINGAGDGGNGRSIIVGPAGDILHQSGHGEEMIPLEIDLDRVRRSREIGLRGLGQPLKSFRDRKAKFDVYREPERFQTFLDTLGPLSKPSRGSRLGIGSQKTGKD